MIIKYLGISFITGALSHGFFSGPRAIAFAIAGVILFVFGSLLEKKDSNATSSVRTLLLSSVLAISIGAFAGGAMHFTDSPERSVFITPLGFIISLVIFFFLDSFTLKAKDWFYIFVSSVLVVFASIGFYAAIEKYDLASGVGGHHGTPQSSHQEEHIEDHSSETKSENIDMKSFLDSDDMKNIPCHQMDGVWMGDCEKNIEGAIIMPSISVSDDHDAHGGEANHH